jgi:anion-transporting  ArsA/GET3 family ATPase
MEYPTGSAGGHEDALLDRTLLYVTGKGGVGKTTVAAALGLAAAARGRRTIVCEVAEQDRVSRAFAREGVQREQEVELAENLWAISIDPSAALREWLARQLGGPALKLVTGSSAFQHFVAAAPGAKELITIAKVWELAQLERWDAHNRTYDLVIVDAPASGHGLAMLTAPSTFGEIARVGPIRRQAHKVRDMLSDPRRTGYVAVALPEEMPVSETLELATRLRDAIGMDLDTIIVNAVYPARFSAKEVEALRAAAGDSLATEALAAVRAALAEHERARTQRAHLRRLRRGADAPVHTLPFLFDAEVGLDEYATLAAKLGRDLG